MAAIEFRNICKVFSGNVRAVENLSLAVGDGEFLVIVGPSGCGKSTVLRMVAGLEEISGGELLIGGQVVNTLKPQARNVAMVFQNYALYPHKTVRKNLEFPLRMQRMPKPEIRRRTERVARLLGLTDHLDKKPKQLSGGQRQRVAMGRAIVRDPQVFLMDEPLSNLDARLRVKIRAEIADLQRRLGTTTLYVTHDQVEAMTLGHRVAVMNRGRLRQVAPALELYDRPADIFVATFIGSPPMNLFPSRLRRSEKGEFRVEMGNHRLPLPACISIRNAHIFHDMPLIAGVRPEGFVRPETVPEAARIRVRVRATETLGHESVIWFESPTPPLSVPNTGAGDPIQKKDGLMAARFPSDYLNRGQEKLTLGVDTSGIHFFSTRGISLFPFDGGAGGMPDQEDI
ncbi:ABC transporter ATP-binding protein [Desulfonema ishimotonii]|uniref:ABC transporter ATP-binding protein n=1 Tax=Desulfonema ishimotonii TaxID=45657 RepID=A0A401FV23_9BACT|nr:sn-glycerol-3-phosphate ABC transporter ATP-binding protein UgpC [Desulfonema ishimotonii]GBC60794.1 ABC transporter ATP-binding protein [Desulfonema ishimotonii]